MRSLKKRLENFSIKMTEVFCLNRGTILKKFLESAGRGEFYELKIFEYFGEIFMEFWKV